MGKTFKLDATLTPGGGEKERGKIGFKEPQTMMQLQENLGQADRDLPIRNLPIRGLLPWAEVASV